MATPTLIVTFTPGQKKARVEINTDRFERLASVLGLFTDDFLKSIDRAERNVRTGKTKKLKSLKDLRRS